MEIIKNGTFTISNDYILDRLITFVTITNPDNNISKKVFALWDTGATRSAIHPDISKYFNFNSIGKTRVQGYSSEKICDLFHANIDIYDILSFSGDIVEYPFTPDGIYFVIGMDIISKGDFILTNFNNTTVMNFICPSTIDIFKHKISNNKHKIIPLTKKEIEENAKQDTK